MSETAFVLTDEPMFTSSPMVTGQTFAVLRDIVRERESSDRKWGEQRHDPAVWMAILTEEVGEAAKEVADGAYRTLDRESYRAELIQVAAVAISAVEALDHGASGLGRSRSATCPRCASPDPDRHPATSFEGEVIPCPHSWHLRHGS